MNKLKKYIGAGMPTGYIYYDVADKCWNDDKGNFYCENKELPDHNWVEYDEHNKTLLCTLEESVKLLQDCIARLKVD